MSQVRETKRFLGLELAGAKNQKTSLAVLEYYPKERKTFLLDIFDRIANHDGQTGDEAVLEVIQEENHQVKKMGVNVALELPPCIGCTRKICPMPARCTVPSVKWMREFTRKSQYTREFTPYTQRPIELWVRNQLLEEFTFEIDETLGGNRAPLSARMNFLKRHLTHTPLVEVWPKLSVMLLTFQMGLSKRTLTSYRHLEEGVHSREEILNQIIKHREVFIYDRDLRKLSTSLTAFDAFICAFTALLSDLDQCAPIPKGFPVSSGWIQYPMHVQKTR